MKSLNTHFSITWATPIRRRCQIFFGYRLRLLCLPKENVYIFCGKSTGIEIVGNHQYCSDTKYYVQFDSKQFWSFCIIVALKQLPAWKLLLHWPLKPNLSVILLIFYSERLAAKTLHFPRDHLLLVPGYEPKCYEETHRPVTVSWLLFRVCCIVVVAWNRISGLDNPTLNMLCERDLYRQNLLYAALINLVPITPRCKMLCCPYEDQCIIHRLHNFGSH